MKPQIKYCILKYLIFLIAALALIQLVCTILDGSVIGIILSVILLFPFSSQAVMLLLGKDKAAQFSRWNDDWQFAFSFLGHRLFLDIYVTLAFVGLCCIIAGFSTKNPDFRLTCFLAAVTLILFVGLGIRKRVLCVREDNEECNRRQEIAHKQMQDEDDYRIMLENLGKKYYDEIQTASKEVALSFSKCMKQKEFRKTLNKMLNVRGDYLPSFSLNDKAKLLFFRDISRAFEKEGIQVMDGSAAMLSMHMLSYYLDGYLDGKQEDVYDWPYEEGESYRLFGIDYDYYHAILDSSTISGNGSSQENLAAKYMGNIDESAEREFESLLNKLVQVMKVQEIIVAPDKQDEPLSDISQGNSSALAQLKELIGLEPVKRQIETLANVVRVNQFRKQQGLKVPALSYHCVFTGNPGTGKTTVARLGGEIYRELGVLKKGHLVETDRSGLVAEWVGQTAVKTNKIIDSAMDGVLFVDEAYMLVSTTNDFGPEAIATLLKRMEDDRERLVVILAGYTDEMKRFIDSNPGLQSRFTRYIEFPDYSEDELRQIFLLNIRKYEYLLTDEARVILNQVLASCVLTRDRNFGNARFIRNLFEKTVEHQSNRLSSRESVGKEDLITILPEDISSAASDVMRHL